MTSLTEWVMRPVPGTFTPRGDALPSAHRLLAALVLLCLIPRVWLALRVETVCDDAFYYASAADAIERGDHSRSFDFLGTNVYPLLLVGLHKLGFEGFAGGMVWSSVRRFDGPTISTAQANSSGVNVRLARAA